MAKISNKLSYPNQNPVEADDYLIGTAANSTPIQKQTKTFTLGDIASFVIDEAFDGCSFRIPVFTAATAGEESFKLVNSIIYQDTAAESEKTPCDVSLGSTIYIDNGNGIGNLYVAGTTTTNGLLKVDGGIYFNSEVYDSNNSIGTGEQVLVSKSNGEVEWQNYQGSGLEFQGAWNADTNTPDLVAIPLTPDNTGKYWIVSVAGTTSLPTQGGGTITDWEIGDWAIISEDLNNNIFWDKIDNSSVLTGQGTPGNLAIWVTDNELGDAAVKAGLGTNSLIFNSATSADGDNSNAFGSGSTASGERSFAAGNGAEAGGNYSVALGQNTDASGTIATAIGNAAEASGTASVAAGNRVEASGAGSTALGQDTIASGEASLATGNNTAASGLSSTAMGENSTASGEYSTAMGSTTTASGDVSTAMGFETIASGDQSTAMGDSTNASGDYSTAMGNGTEASGDASTAIGANTVASADSTFASGEDTTASGIFSTAMGKNSTASGITSTAIGFSANAGGDNAVALGSSTSASGSKSFAVGSSTDASGENSTAMGQNTTAIGLRSLATGLNTDATGDTSTAMGSSTEASGNISTAMGGGTIASGSRSTAMGESTTASGNFSTAMGEGSAASGAHSTAMGGNTTASGDFSTAIGKSSTASGDVSVAIGDANVASGFYAQAYGKDAEASGDNSFAFGTSSTTTASGNGSFSFGADNESQGAESFTMGKDSNTDAAGSFAFGRDNQVNSTATEAFSLGKGHQNAGAESFSIGSSLNATDFRQIVIGSNNVPVIGSVNTWSSIDNLLIIGNGQDAANQSNALEIKKNGFFRLPSYGSGNVIGTPTRNITVDATGNLIETQLPENKFIITGMVNNLASQASGYDFMQWTSNITPDTQIPLFRTPVGFRLTAVTWVWLGTAALNIPVGSDVKFSIGTIPSNTNPVIANYTPISDIFVIDNTDNGTWASGTANVAVSNITVAAGDHIGVVGVETGAVTPNDGELSISLYFTEI